MRDKYAMNALVAAFFSVTMVACSQEEGLDVSDTLPQEYVLQAEIPVTKMGFDAAGTFYWSKGDQIGVTTTVSSADFAKMELNGTYGKGNAQFKGTLNGSPSGYAVYPYAATHRMNGSTLIYNIPDSYTYTHVDKSFYATPQGEGNSLRSMMWGTISNNAISFKHLGGMFAVVIEKMPCAAGSIQLHSDMRLTGDFTVDLNAETPEIRAESNGGDFSMTSLTFSGVTPGESGVFYFPAPTGAYPVVFVWILDDKGKEEGIIPFENKVVNRTKARVLRITEGSVSGGN